MFEMFAGAFVALIAVTVGAALTLAAVRPKEDRHDYEAREAKAGRLSFTKDKKAEEKYDGSWGNPVSGPIAQPQKTEAISAASSPTWRNGR
jgi:hypothetical protein